jgi:hypothetical protein
MQSSRYSHARQMKRAHACTPKLKTQLRRIIGEIERQVETPSKNLQSYLRQRITSMHKRGMTRTRSTRFMSLK